MIGIFDSGSGGLSVMRKIRNRLPSADIVYFGDTKHAPYGGRPRAELSRLTVDGFRTLTTHGATSIVSACNSVSGSLALALLDLSPVPQDRLIEMIAPTARSLAEEDHGRILLVATKATVDSGLYEEAASMLGISVTSVALPELAGMIEEGRSAADIEQYLRTHLTRAMLDTFDTLVLACTHYPLVLDAFRAVVGETVRIVDPGDAVAETVEKRLWPKEAGYGTTKVLLSAESSVFRSHLARLFPEGAGEVEVLE